MNRYSLILDLCESRLIPSKTALKKWDQSKLQELAYLYFLALRVLLANAETSGWAERYCDKTVKSYNFDSWRTDGNDFYVLLYALNSDEVFANDHRSISTNLVRDWLRHVKSQDIDARTHQLFVRLDAMFHVQSSSAKAMRRSIMHWPETKRRERDDIVVKLIQQIHRLASNSELLGQLKDISPQYEADEDKMSESASAGATGAANVAAVSGGLGTGFDPDGHHRSIYKKSKPVIIKRSN